MQLEVERRKIDAIDEKIAALVSERLQAAKRIGVLKGGNAVLVPGREHAILDALASSHPTLPRKAFEGVFHELFAASRAAQKPLQVAVLGPATSYSHQAAAKRFGSLPEFAFQSSIPEVFLAVEKGLADYGVVPIENSSDGAVNATFNMFLKSHAGIVAEINLDIDHCLAGKVPLSAVKKVFSHPQALAQCAHWLASRLPHTELLEAASTSDAAEKALVYHSSAAVCSEFTARHAGLDVLASSIADEALNRTRFLVIGKTEARPLHTRTDKTNLLFSVPHKPGALVEALKVFQAHGLNITKIWSRPTLIQKDAYEFFVDFQGFVGDKKVEQALDELRVPCGFVKVLGSFPEED